MRCEGLVDRAAWRMNGVQGVGVGRCSIFFFFFVLIFKCFLFFHKFTLMRQRQLYIVQGQFIVQISQGTNHVIHWRSVRWLLTKNFSHSWVSLTGKIISDRNWHKLPIWDFTQFGCLDCWLTKHILDTELSGVFATVWEICPHSDSGCKMCPFSNKTERFAGVHLGTQ